LLVISSSVSHDRFKSIFTPQMSERQELLLARAAAGAAVIVAGYFGINPPGFVAQVVAYAFGLAASSFFPILVLGVFSKRATKQGAIAGMLSGIGFTGAYIVFFTAVRPEAGSSGWLFGISPEGIGTVGMLLNFAVTLVVSRLTPAPPREVQELVEEIRLPHKP
jgi:cation/acetate symporter